MQIYFVHIPSQMEVSLKTLKDGISKEFCFIDHRYDRDYRYFAKDIPLSDDFKTKCLDNSFTIVELEQIKNALYKNNYHPNINLIDKVNDKLIELLRATERK